MQQVQKPTIDDIKALTSPPEGFLCSVKDNIYDIYFIEFRIRDVQKKKILFQMKRNPEEARSKIHVEDDSYRSITYQFPPDFFLMKTIGTSLVFGVGSKPIKELYMIEKHFFLDQLIATYEFTFPFCIPDSTNTWESIYDLPQLDEEQQIQMILNPGATKSDTFYFVDGQLVMHNKADYDYASLVLSEEYQQKEPEKLTQA